MHVITIRKLREFWQQHPDAEEPLRRWYRISKKEQWENLAETRREFPHVRSGWCLHGLQHQGKCLSAY